MNCVATLSASAEAYLVCGDELSAAMCSRMAAEAEALGPIGERLYRHWASEQAERSARKLAEHNERKAA